MSDRTKTPPETPTAKLARPAPTGYRDEHGCYHPAPDTPAFVEHVRTCDPCKKHLGQPFTWATAGFNFVRPAPRSASVPDPMSPRYHTFTFEGARQDLVPPDWYDGTPKQCLGSGMPPGVQYHGEVSEDGEPKYLCRCPWCDKPFRPGLMPEHAFVPSPHGPSK